jgi:hypothetical protein
MMRPRSQLSTQAALEAVIEDVIAGRIDVMDWWRPMARTTKPTRDDVTVKMDRSLVAKARYVADNKGISLAEYLTGAMLATVMKEFNLVAKEKP